MNATIKLEKKHFPVLLSDLTNIISPLYGGTFIDCTFGQGGYSNKILEDPSNKVIAIDRDKKTYLYAKKLKNKYKSNFEFRNLKFFLKLSDNLITLLSLSNAITLFSEFSKIFFEYPP